MLYSATIFRVKSILWGDSLYYFAHTHSIIVDGDIDFTNEAFREVDGFPNKPEFSKITGRVINKFSPGSSILWIPGFLIGYIFSGGDGYSFITQYFVAISAIIFSVIGLYFTNKILLFFVNTKIASLTVVFLYLTTQMFYYTSLDPLNSHSASFMVSTIFFYLLISFSKNSFPFMGQVYSWQKMLILGFFGGLMVLIRNQDIVILLPASILFLIKNNKGIMEAINRLILYWGTVFLVLSIQLFITLELYGQLGSPYLIGGEKLSWLRPDFIRVLFSFENGLFTFAPILLFSFLGLIYQIYTKKNINIKQLFIISIFAFLLQLYVIASWSKEIIGGPYGSRMFISVLPYLSIGLASILEKYQDKNNFKIAVATIIIILFSNNLIQTAIMLIRF